MGCKPFTIGTPPPPSGVRESAEEAQQGVGVIAGSEILSGTHTKDQLTPSAAGVA